MNFSKKLREGLVSTPTFKSKKVLPFVDFFDPFSLFRGQSVFLGNFSHAKQFKSRCGGFSLVELLVYIGSMTLILLALAYVLGSTYGVYTSMASASRADRAAGTLAQVLSTELRSGATVDQANSIFNSAQGQLTIDAFDGVDEIEKVFSLEDGRVVFSFDDEDTYMTPADMEVSKFLFTQVVTPISYAVRFEIDITYVAGGELETRTYPGVVVLKRSYD